MSTVTSPFNRPEHGAKLGAGEACPRVRVAPAWAGPSAVAGKAFRIQDGKLVHGLFPAVHRLGPIGGDIAQCQPYQLGCRVITGEMAARLDDLAHARIDALDRIRASLR